MACRAFKYEKWFSLHAILLFASASDSSLADALAEDVYVWQRAWTEPVRQALREHGDAFARVVVLKAEVTWHESKPQLSLVPVDFQTLASLKPPFGLALRIGPYSGSFESANPATTYLADLCEKLVKEARSAGRGPDELQIDFDCASSKLDGYRSWVEVIRQRVKPLPVVITALPSWLGEASFRALIQAADGFVLQVHSLERPKNYDAEFTLCDPAATQRAVAKAAGLGVSFRVALPTYGYLVGYDGQGRFIGLSAEGPAKSWPADVRLKEVRSDPVEMARLVQEWTSTPPAGLKGIIWYRLPVPGDILNWRWPTLGAILQARILRKSVRVDSHRVESGLVEISLINDGELDISSRLAVQTRWQVARLVAGDGLHGFELADRGVSSARFDTGARPYYLPAGERQAVGWLRLNEDREVQVEIEEFDGR